MKPESKNPSSSKLNRNNKGSNDFAKFSGLAFELLGIVAAGIGTGYFLDSILDNQIPVLTIVFSFLSLIGMIVYLLRRLPKD